MQTHEPAQPVLKQFKVSRTLDRRINARAAKLGLTPQNYLRMLMVQAVSEDGLPEFERARSIGKREVTDAPAEAQ